MVYKEKNKGDKRLRYNITQWNLNDVLDNINDISEISPWCT